MFDAGELIVRPRREAAWVNVEVADEDVTGVAGVALWGPLLDRLDLVGVADRRRLRPIGPGGYTGGQCYRTIVEVLLAGGDFVSDRSLLAEATQRAPWGAPVAVALDVVPVPRRRRSRSGPRRPPR